MRFEQQVDSLLSVSVSFIEVDLKNNWFGEPVFGIKDNKIYNLHVENTNDLHDEHSEDYYYLIDKSTDNCYEINDFNKLYKIDIYVQ